MNCEERRFICELPRNPRTKIYGEEGVTHLRKRKRMDDGESLDTLRLMQRPGLVKTMSSRDDGGD